MCTDRQTDRRTDRTTTVTLAAHARRGLISSYMFVLSLCNEKEYHKNYIVLVILSHTHLNVCSVMFTSRASPRVTPPASPIVFPSRLCLDNRYNFILQNTQSPPVLQYCTDQCVRRKQIVMVIVKWECLNLRSHITATVALPALKWFVKPIADHETYSQSRTWKVVMW